MRVKNLALQLDLHFVSQNVPIVADSSSARSFLRQDDSWGVVQGRFCASKMNKVCGCASKVNKVCGCASKMNKVVWVRAE